MAKIWFALFRLITVFALVQSTASAADGGWSSLASGSRIVFIRHAVTEAGIGDPPGFQLGDCGTQRNLSSQGRADAKLIGDEFRRRKIVVDEVLSSRWCRCIDTAVLAFGQPKQTRMLDSMFNDRSKPDEEKIREVQAYAGQRKGAGHVVFVTHAQNIQALTGVSPATGEIIVTEFVAGKFKVIARIDPPRS